MFRWLSQDDVEYLDITLFNGMNLFLYCNSNPVMFADDNGNWPVLLTIMCVSAAISILTTAIEDITDEEQSTTFGEYVGNTVVVLYHLFLI